jgi:hypothetical protein
MKSRIPTKEEKIELVEYILKHDLKNDENERANIEGFVESAAIAVFDNYITSSPGYSGKLMVVVYEGSPEMTETYTWVKENESNIAKLYRNIAINNSNSRFAHFFRDFKKFNVLNFGHLCDPIDLWES